MIAINQEPSDQGNKMLTPIIIILILSSPLAVAFALANFKISALDLKKYSCWGLGCAFVFFFIGHIVQAEGMVTMLPPWVPYRLALVYLTGLLELLIAIALFIPKWQTRAATTAVVVLVVFFPANIYAAFNSVGLGGHQWGPSYLLIRAPLQIILIGWAYFLCIQTKSIPETRKA